MEVFALCFVCQPEQPHNGSEVLTIWDVFFLDSDIFVRSENICLFLCSLEVYAVCQLEQPHIPGSHRGNWPQGEPAGRFFQDDIDIIHLSL